MRKSRVEQFYKNANGRYESRAYDYTIELSAGMSVEFSNEHHCNEIGRVEYDHQIQDYYIRRSGGEQWPIVDGIVLRVIYND